MYEVCVRWIRTQDVVSTHHLLCAPKSYKFEKREKKVWWNYTSWHHVQPIGIRKEYILLLHFFFLKRVFLLSKKKKEEDTAGGVVRERERHAGGYSFRIAGSSQHQVSLCCVCALRSSSFDVDQHTWVIGHHSWRINGIPA